MRNPDAHRTDLPPAGSKARHALRSREQHRRRRYQRVTLGPYDLVLPYEARYIVKQLRDAGFTFKRMEEITELDTRQLTGILKRETPRIKKHTHDHLRSLDLQAIIDSEPRGRRIPRGPYRELLRRYLAAGWSRAEMVAIAGPPLRENSDIWRDRGKWMSPEMADAIDKMHAELGERVKTDPKDRDKARMTWLRTRGYKPPAAYDKAGGA